MKTKSKSNFNTLLELKFFDVGINFIRKKLPRSSKLLLFLGFSFLLIGFISCKKFLDESPNKKLAELSSVSDLQALLDDNTIMNSYTPGFGETSADDYFLPIETFNSLPQFSRSAYGWELNDYKFPNDWARGYNAIYNSNYCISYLGKIARDEKNGGEWDNVLGSAYFFRAFWSLHLLWDYTNAYDESTSKNDLGIVIRLSPDPSIASERSSVQKCYEQILQDFKYSLDYLPLLPLHVMRPSRAAAFGYLSRAYLSMRSYDSAFKYADLALKIRSSLMDYNDPSVVDPPSTTPFRPFNSEIIFYSDESGSFGTKGPLTGLVDTTLYSSFGEDDLRKTAYFYEYGGYYTFKGNYNADDIFTLFSGLATDELYLTRSECYARNGQLDEAMNDLNLLLKKRWSTGKYLPYTASNKEDAIQSVLKERRKELLMRGLRWIDIKRLNKEGANISIKRVADKTYILPANSDKFALPLPKDIIELAGIPQNPSW